MKQPRVDDFDPNVAPPLKSSLDDMPTIEKPSIQAPVVPPDDLQTHPVDAEPVHQVEQGEEILSTNYATKVRTNERFNERTKVRHTFDILADQLLALREISIERQKMFGERVLLGDLVQEALDMFIATERNKQ